MKKIRKTRKIIEEIIVILIYILPCIIAMYGAITYSAYGNSSTTIPDDMKNVSVQQFYTNAGSANSIYAMVANGINRMHDNFIVASNQANNSIIDTTVRQINEKIIGNNAQANMWSNYTSYIITVTIYYVVIKIVINIIEIILSTRDRLCVEEE